MTSAIINVSRVQTIIYSFIVINTVSNKMLKKLVFQTNKQIKIIIIIVVVVVVIVILNIVTC
jgi:hypothetical protein